MPSLKDSTKEIIREIRGAAASASERLLGIDANKLQGADRSILSKAKDCFGQLQGFDGVRLDEFTGALRELMLLQRGLSAGGKSGVAQVPGPFDCWDRCEVQARRCQENC